LRVFSASNNRDYPGAITKLGINKNSTTARGESGTAKKPKSKRVGLMFEDR